MATGLIRTARQKAREIFAAGSEQRHRLLPNCSAGNGRRAQRYRKSR